MKRSDEAGAGQWPVRLRRADVVVSIAADDLEVGAVEPAAPHRCAAGPKSARDG